MKKYYVCYPRGFVNEYSLMYVENEADIAALPEKATRIRYEEAVRLCREENKRIRHDRNFSGFADNTVLPASYDYVRDGDPYRNPSYVRVGYVWERTRIDEATARGKGLYLCRKDA